MRSEPVSEVELSSPEDVGIRYNVISNSTDDACMDLDGDGMAVIGNKCLGQNYYGLYVDGDHAEIQGNLLDGAQNEPIYVDGDFARCPGISFAVVTKGCTCPARPRPSRPTK